MSIAIVENLARGKPSEMVSRQLAILGATTESKKYVQYRDFAIQGSRIDSALNDCDVSRFVFSTFMVQKGYDSNSIAQKLRVPSNVISRYRSLLPISYDEFISRRNIMPEAALRSEIHQNRMPRSPLVMLGTTPSGPLHLANMYTMITGIQSIAKVLKENPKRTLTPQFHVGFNDFTIKESEFEHVAERKRILAEFLSKVSTELCVPIKLESFSDLQRTPAFRRVLQKAINEDYENNYRRDLRIKVQEVVDGEYVPRNSGALQRESNYALENLMQTIALRVATIKPDIYLLGGDHSHLFNPFELAEELADGYSPTIFRTGTMYGLDGEEMHVSKQNFVSYESLRGIPNLVQKVAALSQAPVEFVGPLDYYDLLPESVTTVYGLNRMLN